MTIEEDIVVWLRRIAQYDMPFAHVAERLKEAADEIELLRSQGDRETYRGTGWQEIGKNRSSV